MNSDSAGYDASPAKAHGAVPKPRHKPGVISRLPEEGAAGHTARWMDEASPL